MEVHISSKVMSIKVIEQTVFKFLFVVTGD